MYAVCNLSVIPVRKETSDKSEQVTQLLFGESVEIIDKKDNWRKVRVVFDDYTGWVDKKQLAEVSEDFVKKLASSPTFLTSDLLQLAIWNQNQICPLVIGSTLPLYDDKKFFVGDSEYSFEGNVIDASKRHKEHIQEQSYMYLNSPYQWGGRSPFGIDCSGFTQMVFKLCGIKLKRDSDQQAEQGQTVNLVEESDTGDLAFFENKDGRIVHVGIILPGRHIMHASGRVRIDKLDHQGIYNEELKSYSHKLRLIKRIV